MTEFERKLREELCKATTTKQVDGIHTRYKHSGIDWTDELGELCKNRWIHLSLCEYSPFPGVPTFRPFAKMPRLNRLCTITEKLDGTNACVYVSDWGDFAVGSRTRWITPTDDNYGFARWAFERKEELLKLGPGTHFGEWWGQGIQRGYGLTEKRFSLFNTQRWCLHGETPKARKQVDPTQPAKMQDVLPECVSLVPVLYEGIFNTAYVEGQVQELRANGSRAAPGFAKPEGVVVFHHAANSCFKVTLDKDEEPKGRG